MWIILYLAAAVVSLSPIRRWTALAAFTLEGAAILWAVVIALNTRGFTFTQLFESMKAETPAIEQSREILGLALIAIWMLILGIVSLRVRFSHKHDTATRTATPVHRD
ncbi:MAG: transmembrane 220 family protein [Phycisphaerales bacterium]